LDGGEKKRKGDLEREMLSGWILEEGEAWDV
jgi:hypothetical protein